MGRNTLYKQANTRIYACCIPVFLLYFYCARQEIAVLVPKRCRIDPVTGGDMAKLGQYTYPDIRFGDAVEISGRVLTKFKGTVSVKGLAWELGMAEGSGTLFAKVAAMRDFGLIEGRGELRISQLAQRVLHPATPEEGQAARAEAFQRVDLLRQLYDRFEGEVPDDMSMLVGLEEITRASRDEIVRRAPLIQKHLTDAIRVLGRPVRAERKSEHSVHTQNMLGVTAAISTSREQGEASSSGLHLSAGGRQLSVPLTPEYIDVAITLLSALKGELRSDREIVEEADGVADDEETSAQGMCIESANVAALELGSIEQLDLPSEAQA
jgi:hypothetical protein